MASGTLLALATVLFKAAAASKCEENCDFDEAGFTATVIGMPALLLGLGAGVSSLYGYSAVQRCEDEQKRVANLGTSYDAALAAADRGDCDEALRIDRSIKESDPDLHITYLAYNRTLRRCVVVHKPTATPIAPTLMAAPIEEELEQIRAKATEAFEVCRANHGEMMQKALALTDVRERGDFLVTIPKCYRP